MKRTVRRYLVFCYDVLHPNGGWGDCRGSFDTKEEAVAESMRDNTESTVREIVDTTTGVYESLSYGEFFDL